MAEATPAPAPAAAPAPAPATPAPAVPVSAATPEPAAPAPAEPQGYWPADWQKNIAGDDEKVLKQVQRYQSPKAIWEKARSLEQRLSSGELKPSLPKNAKPEEIAAWRKDSGIPEKPDGYELKGLEVPKEDKALIDGFLARAHAAHYLPEQAKEAVASYYDMQKRVADARMAKDEEQRLKTIDEVAQEWGGKFSQYKTRIENYLTMFPASVRDSLKGARFPDGTLIFNNSDVLRSFVALSLKEVPEGIHVPSDGGDLGKSMLDRYNELNKMMSERRGDWNKDEGAQAEHRQLIEALQKNGIMDEHGNLKKAA